MHHQPHAHTSRSPPTGTARHGTHNGPPSPGQGPPLEQATPSQYTGIQPAAERRVDTQSEERGEGGSRKSSRNCSGATGDRSLGPPPTPAAQVPGWQPLPSTVMGTCGESSAMLQQAQPRLPEPPAAEREKRQGPNQPPWAPRGPVDDPADRRAAAAAAVRRGGQGRRQTKGMETRLAQPTQGQGGVRGMTPGSTSPVPGTRRHGSGRDIPGGTCCRCIPPRTPEPTRKTTAHPMGPTHDQMQPDKPMPKTPGPGPETDSTGQDANKLHLAPVKLTEEEIYQTPLDVCQGPHLTREMQQQAPAMISLQLVQSRQV
ncbi:proline-rich protein 2-like [Corythoichthys intestinalis]|uniref:proline-rich protein 2-like n=1 Tax=Corythoichthys intestinalis TaxID=161448 RepID=UPI0025A51D31|nr:proline-rich protein 2-like [Corythoichthys intestinalis]